MSDKTKQRKCCIQYTNKELDDEIKKDVFNPSMLFSDKWLKSAVDKLHYQACAAVYSMMKYNKINRIKSGKDERIKILFYAGEKGDIELIKLFFRMDYMLFGGENHNNTVTHIYKGAFTKKNKHAMEFLEENMKFSGFIDSVLDKVK